MITADHVTPGAVAFTFIGMASDMGLPVAPPRTLPTTLGNGQPLRLIDATEQEWHYTQDLGCTSLTVFND